MYEFWLFLHIAAAAAWIGAAIRQLVEAPVVQAGAPAARALWYRSSVAMGTRLFAPAAVIVLVSGILLVVDNEAVGFGTPFVSIGFAAVIFGATVGPAVFGKRGEAAAAKLEDGDAAGADAIAKKTRPIELLDITILLVTLAAMVWKWGL
ncbi:MAG: hypothetical protein WD990_07555 [Acidimicrobiia bacterium]